MTENYSIIRRHMGWANYTSLVGGGHFDAVIWQALSPGENFDHLGHSFPITHDWI